jgi:sec-independent protein translocase protein TatA
MGPIGVPELIIIFVVALIVFGPRKLPELGKSLGKGLAEFRRASNELKSTIEEEVRAIENETPATFKTEPDSKSISRSSSEVDVDAH